MMSWLLLSIVFAAIGAWLFWPRTKRETQHAAKTDRLSGKYHCVSVRHRANACQAVKRLAGKRFLSKEAPRLPLSNCDVAKCRCRYVHFADRRAEDRRNPYKQALFVPHPDRRTGVDRRRTELVD